MKQYKTIDVARRIGIHVNTVRLYEKCALIPKLERLPNGYRDIQRLKIIRSLRCANYSLAAILRMLRAINDDPAANIRTVIDTPNEDDDIIKACDKLLTSLAEARKNAVYVAGQIEKMQKMTK